MKERIRAIRLTAVGTMLVINRVRPGIPPYQVLVGGGVEPEDADLAAGLLREVREEIAGGAVNLHPFCQLENGKSETEHFYLAQILAWNFDDRTGPEFTSDDRGKYLLEEVPLTVEAVEALNLMPPQVRDALLDAIRGGSLTGPHGVASQPAAARPIPRRRPVTAAPRQSWG
ncbi:NUDIX domain-containing protein [Streptomyces sp. AP-93]|uniref:NUDIX domain-containing protein n=1 Tax=Streptomyces sp. AP-93 TaxID=2929048 RepID=UPI001FAF14D5|nr:NUDIX domain-containing protein [Streptomyces sp. AP-93]MCJ0875682.1 NUDIX domain-containing protein [Streptomyces sp. AP-93]